MQRVPQRRQRVSQLVRQRRQKLVLAAVGLAQLTDELKALLVEAFLQTHELESGLNPAHELARTEGLVEVVVGAP